jgi:DNA replication protein DnaC
MPRPDPKPTQLDRDLADLKLLEIAKRYREVLDEAARKGASMLEVLGTLLGMEQTVRAQRALERRLRQARLPKLKTLADYDFSFPKRIPKTAMIHLFLGIDDRDAGTCPFDDLGVAPTRQIEAPTFPRCITS